MTDIQDMKIEQVDLDSIKKMHKEFKQNYEQKVSKLTSTFQQMQAEMKRDYDAQLNELDKL